MNKQNIDKAASFIKEKINKQPKIGLILGSGLGVLVDEIENQEKIPFHTIPEFATSTVEGHEGQLVFGNIHDIEVVAMQGRVHFYEGYSMEKVTFPIRIMKELGVEILIVTNAAGGVNTSFMPGDLMLITDHINFTGTNPLIGPNNPELGVRFVDMSYPYDRDLQELAKSAAKDVNVKLQEGVYVALTGPSYETPAEIRMFRTLGADAVGMSTVSEVIVARHAEIRVIGISCISNMAAGILDQPLNHEEVIETTQRVRTQFLSLVKEIVRKMG
ncbi:purine-nucleoside phosphorylase [Gottfriedia sp. NPDC057991]|uniref:purine-nucleoside phosphorylase n=1 Tax=Gottfriedia sp. NPDC057991 TaxID=3346298 RepID=UPI0036DE8ECB